MLEIDILAPLRFFYGLASRDLPVTFVPPEALPERDRHLLAHSQDMTSRLADFHGSGLILDAQASTRMGDYLVRCSVLRRKDTHAPVEFGAIGIDLGCFADEPRLRVLEARIPLGGLLQHYSIPFTSHPRGYFQIVIDHRLEDLLQGEPGQILYGRCNELRQPDGRVIAEVAEILPR
ncbi:MAG: hypothetical protein JNM66_12175 [Bryobacterales bacterium]|nr:hypothetical protein [Bryobacterales bacterium]